MNDGIFDLVTIGGGSGGFAASVRAAQHGARVAICESDRFGGTCVIRGCVPKKFYWQAAGLRDSLRDAVGYGWRLQINGFDLDALWQAKETAIRDLSDRYVSRLQSAGVTIVPGQATITGPGEVRVGAQRLQTRKLLVATGSQTASPGIDGLDLALTSNGLLELRTLPRRLVILGGGYVATEFASLFKRFGSQVTMVYREALPMRRLDHDLRVHLSDALSSAEIRLTPGFQVERLEQTSEGVVAIADDGRRLEPADVVLNALGRVPNTAGLGLENVGIDLGARGQIPVDDQQRTRKPDVFAVGDVTDRVPLTPVAIAEGRAFADRVFGGLDRRVDHRRVPTAVFSLPPLATVGMTEEAAIESGHRVVVYEADFRPLLSLIPDAPDRVYLKLVVDANDERVLGAHMIGADAPEIIQSLAPALTAAITKPQLDATLALHPTIAEEWVLLRTPRAEV